MDVFFNSIAEDFWGSEDELTGALSEKLIVGIECVCKFVWCLSPWWILNQKIYNGNIMQYTIL